MFASIDPLQLNGSGLIVLMTKAEFVARQLAQLERFRDHFLASKEAPWQTWEDFDSFLEEFDWLEEGVPPVVDKRPLALRWWRWCCVTAVWVVWWLKDRFIKPEPRWSLEEFLMEERRVLHTMLEDPSVPADRVRDDVDWWPFHTSHHKVRREAYKI